MQAETRHSLTRRSWLAGAAVTAAAQEPAQTVRLPKKIRVGMLGLVGHTGEILRPLPQLPDVEVTAFCDTDRELLARTAKNPRLSGARSYDDYRRMLATEEFDLVAVNNSNGDRAEAILACLERKLHVIAEKPLAIRRADFEKVREAVARTKASLGMLLPMRFASQYLALRQAVQSGEIGEVAQISAQKSYKAGSRAEWMRRRASYGSTILWIGIHMVDLMRWASGREFTQAYSIQANVGLPRIGEMESTTASVFRLDNGGAAALHMDYYRADTASTHGDDRLRLAGPGGVVEYQAATGVTLMTGKQAPRRITELPASRSLFVDFLESVYLGKPSALSLADIYRVNEIVLGAHESAETGRVVKL